MSVDSAEGGEGSVQEPTIAELLEQMKKKVAEASSGGAKDQKAVTSKNKLVKPKANTTTRHLLDKWRVNVPLQEAITLRPNLRGIL